MENHKKPSEIDLTQNFEGYLCRCDKKYLQVFKLLIPLGQVIGIKILFFEIT
jgi:hypothetical protein